MAFGKPVVSTERGILPELLAGRRHTEVPGFAVEESDRALGDALLRLLRDPSERASCGAAALRRTQLDMNPSIAAERTSELYSQLLAERNG
jgi:glycosyltransferase involved in cell wall biosynthesis